MAMFPSPTEETWALVRARCQQMPAHLKLHILGKTLSKEDILAHLNRRDEIGRKILEVQLTYLRSLKELPALYDQYLAGSPAPR